MERDLQGHEIVYIACKAGSALLRVCRWTLISEDATRLKTFENSGLRHESGTQHAKRWNAREPGGRIRLTQICQTTLSRQEVDRDREERRRKRQVIYRAQILAHAIDAVAATDGSGVATTHIVSETNTRLKNRSVVIVEGAALQGAGQARKIKLVRALGVHKRLSRGGREFWIGVAQMT